MRHKLIERLVVHGCNHSGIGGSTVGSVHLQLPLLLLARCQSVTECVPAQCQCLVGLRLHDCVTGLIEFAIFPPGIEHLDAIAIQGLIGEITANDGVAQLDGAAFQATVGTHHGIKHMHVVPAGP